MIAYTRPDGGVSVIAPTGEITISEVMRKDVPAGAADVQLLDSSDLPDYTFRNAWRTGPAKKIEIDLAGAKDIAHELRRIKRATELAPLDIEASIPAKAQEAEARRQVVRDKYAAIQAQIDGCSTPDQLKAIISMESL